MEPAQHRIDVLHGEVAVFEVEQQPNADGDGDAAEQFLHAGLFGIVHPTHQIKVGNDGQDEVDDEFRRAPSVENERGE